MTLTNQTNKELPKRVGLNGIYCEAAVHGDTVYLAGQVAVDGSTTIAAQTRSALAQIEARLAEVGSEKNKLLSATIWLQNLSDYEGMNAVWEEWVSPTAPPVRATAAVQLADPAFLIEIIAVAAL